MDETFRKVEERLRLVRGWDGPITPETEVYGDLGISGDDLALEVVLWATREFGMEGTFHLLNYAPGERPFQWLRKLLGIQSRQYKSLTVRDVVLAIEAKRWPDS